MYALDPVLFASLDGSGIKQFEQADAETLGAVEQAMPAQGRGEAVIEPRVHLMPCPTFDNPINILSDRVRVAPLGSAIGEAS